MSAPDVTQIKIGRHTFGFVGLNQALKKLAESHADASDSTAAEALLEELSKRNYIPENVREAYGRAFVREFRKYLGQPFQTDEQAQGLVIKVLGGGCNICDSIENDLMEILAELGVAADLEHVRDPAQIAKYKVRGTPALVINDKVMCVGSAPPRNQIKQWIEQSGHPLKTGGNMEKTEFIKNIPFSEPQQLENLVDYEPGRVVSRTFAQKSSLSVTLFAFDQGEGVSTHTAPGDAMVQVLDGEAQVDIDGNKMTVGAGQVVVMPANIPHAVTAEKRFKMLLTVVK